MRIIFTMEARKDLLESLEYMADKNTEMVEKISKQVQYTCELLSRMPDMGTRVNLSKEIEALDDEIQEVLNAKNFFKKMRKFSVVDFKNLIIFYQMAGDDLEVIRIIHSSRDIPFIFMESN